jgi:alpha-tubulin suppressor-like RCC1 family protein
VSPLGLASDLDMDGIPDSAEQAVGLNHQDPGDAAYDLDSDGIANFWEYFKGTGINNAAESPTLKPGLAQQFAFRAFQPQFKLSDPCPWDGTTGIVFTSASGEMFRNDGSTAGAGFSFTYSDGTVASPGISDPVQMAGHALALTEGGRVYDFTTNKFASDPGIIDTPEFIPELRGIIGISSFPSQGGSRYSAVDINGEVWEWFRPSTIVDILEYAGGQTFCNAPVSGDAQRTTPTRRADVSGARQVSTGANARYATLTDGTVLAWGINDRGQLGNGTTDDSTTPVPVAIDNVAQVSAGREFALALKRDGTVWAWGSNEFGRLGANLPAGAEPNLPVRMNDVAGGNIEGIDDVVKIAAGWYHGLALKKDGSVVAWGRNSVGELGDGTTNDTFIPVPVTGLADVVDIAAGYQRSMALTASGEVWFWGSSLSPTIKTRVPDLAGTGFLDLGASILDSDDDGVPDILDEFPLDPDETRDNDKDGLGDNADLDDDNDGVSDLDEQALGLDPLDPYDTATDNDGDGWALYLEVLKGTNPTDGGDAPEYGMGLATLSETSNHAWDYQGDLYGWGANSSGQLGRGNDIATPIAVDVPLDKVIAGAIDEHSLVLRSTGDFLAVGDNDSAQTSRPASGEETAVAPVSGLENGNPVPFNVIDLAASEKGAFAVGAGGQLWVWGDNGFDQFGDPDAAPTFSQTPRRVAILNDKEQFIPIVQIEAGDYFAIARTADNRLFGWGANSAGQIGNGSTLAVESPIEIPLSVTPGELALGAQHVLMIDGSGILYSWGSNSAGQLGRTGSAANTPLPVDYGGTKKFIKVAAGNQHSLALTEDNLVYAWGNNSNGAVGAGMTQTVAEPTLVPNLDSIVDIQAGSNHSLALHADGRVFAWGRNASAASGVLGADLADAIYDTPQVVLDPSASAPLVLIDPATDTDGDGVANVSDAFPLDPSEWLDTDGDGIGNNTDTDDDGDGLTDTQEVNFGLDPLNPGDINVDLDSDGWATYLEVAKGSNPLLPSSVPSFQAMLASSTSSRSFFAIDSLGDTVAWGENGKGELGNGGTGDVSTPQPGPVSQVVSLSAGSEHAVALLADGSLRGWGDNLQQEIAQAGSGPFLSPQPIVGISGVVEVEGGWDSTLMVNMAGEVIGFGDNTSGKLGIGQTGGIVNTPTKAVGLTGVVDVEAGFVAAAALTQTGDVYTWGSNAQGQLGVSKGLVGQRDTPGMVPGLPNIQAICSGQGHVLALDQGGVLWAWGWNQEGQLGNGSGGSFVFSDTPAQVIGLGAAVTAIACGSLHSLALDVNGDVWAWGNGDGGALGTGVLVDAYNPVLVASLQGQNITQISIANDTNLAMDVNGKLWTWGGNSSGQLGVGEVGGQGGSTLYNSPVPLDVLGGDMLPYSLPIISLPTINIPAVLAPIHLLLE